MEYTEEQINEMLQEYYFTQGYIKLNMQSIVEIDEINLV